ncbi:SMC-Scp complex subunit ScpB [Lamprobacter modestohalophilus]|uniref:SMC-Scp complex subunit ScpB n=1 Tax=Lamprobacter modestohalophilus TaxID=1064514 RepID=A0A9X0WAZ3_9GAMM|nr:SMC-Scp complex subunit ScpB [Lamprobacter modestohalophilus]
MSDWEQGHGADDELAEDCAAEDAEDSAPRQHALSLLVPELKQVVEAALLASGEPLSVERIQGLFDDRERPSRDQVLATFEALREDYKGHGIELVEVAGGWRAQVRASVAPWVGQLWQEKPSRYSRALLETLALIAYRQPITRGEIEQIRGVAVSTPIIKTLSEREWVRVVGHRDVPGRPALYATTRRFLDYFGLRSLNELPPLAEIRDASFFEQALAEAADGAHPGPAAASTALASASAPASAEDAVDDSLGAESLSDDRLSDEGADHFREHPLAQDIGAAPQPLVKKPSGRPHLVLAVSNRPPETRREPAPSARPSEPFADTNERTGDGEDEDEGR